MTRRAALPLAVALALLAGCSFLKKSEPRLFALETIPPASPAALVAPELPLGIEALTLPPELDRRELVVDHGDPPLDVRQTDLWAAPLDRLLLHTLAFDLAARLPEGSVVLPGQPRPAAVLPITVAVETLTAGPDARVTLDVHWTAAGVTRRETVDVPAASLDSPDVVAATSVAVAELADRIRRAILTPIPDIR